MLRHLIQDNWNVLVRYYICDHQAKILLLFEENCPGGCPCENYSCGQSSTSPDVTTVTAPPSTTTTLTTITTKFPPPDGDDCQGGICDCGSHGSMCNKGELCGTKFQFCSNGILYEGCTECQQGSGFRILTGLTNFKFRRTRTFFDPIIRI